MIQYAKVTATSPLTVLLDGTATALAVDGTLQAGGTAPTFTVGDSVLVGFVFDGSAGSTQVIVLGKVI